MQSRWKVVVYSCNFVNSWLCIWRFELELWFIHVQGKYTCKSVRSRIVRNVDIVQRLDYVVVGL